MHLLVRGSVRTWCLVLSVAAVSLDWFLLPLAPLSIQRFLFARVLSLPLPLRVCLCVGKRCGLGERAGTVYRRVCKGGTPREHFFSSDFSISISVYPPVFFLIAGLFYRRRFRCVLSFVERTVICSLGCGVVHFNTVRSIFVFLAARPLVMILWDSLLLMFLHGALVSRRDDLG